VYIGVVTRTNIDLDDDLVERVMERYRLRTKREAVHFALSRVAGDPMSRHEALAMEGTGWEEDLAELRRSRIEHL
jgi:Arc/MetJ family transcription regulator